MNDFKTFVLVHIIFKSMGSHRGTRPQGAYCPGCCTYFTTNLGFNNECL